MHIIGMDRYCYEYPFRKTIHCSLKDSEYLSRSLQIINFGQANPLILFYPKILYYSSSRSGALPQKYLFRSSDILFLLVHRKELRSIFFLLFPLLLTRIMPCAPRRGERLPAQTQKLRKKRGPGFLSF